VPNDGPNPGDTVTSAHAHANRVSSLNRVQVRTNMTLDAITSEHYDVFYIQAEMQPLLDSLAATLSSEYTERLKLNAMSLIYGGINDVANNWAERNHRYHRWGTDADLDWASNPVSVDSLKLLGKLAEVTGFQHCPEEGDHVHCYVTAYW
jgi:hypothetical protein